MMIQEGSEKIVSTMKTNILVSYMKDEILDAVLKVVKWNIAKVNNVVKDEVERTLENLRWEIDSQQ